MADISKYHLSVGSVYAIQFYAEQHNKFIVENLLSKICCRYLSSSKCNPAAKRILGRRCIIKVHSQIPIALPNLAVPQNNIFLWVHVGKNVILWHR